MDTVKKDKTKELIDYLGDSGSILKDMMLRALDGTMHERDRLIAHAVSVDEVIEIEKNAKDIMTQYIFTIADIWDLWSEITGDLDYLNLSKDFAEEFRIG